MALPTSPPRTRLDASITPGQLDPTSGQHSSSLTLRILDSFGTPISDGTTVYLLQAPSSAATIGITLASAVSTDGIVYFDSVPIAQSLSVSIRGSLYSVSSLDTPGDSKSATVIMNLNHPELWFRAIDDKGNPLRNGRLSCQLYTLANNDTAASYSIRISDGFGMSSFELRGHYVEGDLRFVCITDHQASIGARIDISRELPNEQIQLGDIPFLPAPIVLRGQVVDGEKPVVGATIAYQALCGNGATADWSSLDIDVRSDREGRFSLRSMVQSALWRVQATSEGYCSRRKVFAPGSEAKLELMQHLTIGGTIQLDRGVSTRGMSCVLKSEDTLSAKEIERNTSRCNLAKDGAFTLYDVLPGRYHLCLQLGSSEIMLGSVVVPEKADLESLVFDMRGTVRRVDIICTATDYVDAQIDGVVYVERDGSNTDNIWILDSGTAMALVTEPSITGTILARGFLAEEFKCDEPTCRQMLRQAPKIVLDLPRSVSLPADPFGLYVALTPVQGSLYQEWWGPFVRGSEIEVFPYELGDFEIHVEVRRVFGSGSLFVRGGRADNAIRVVDLSPVQRKLLDAKDMGIKEVLGGF